MKKRKLDFTEEAMLMAVSAYLEKNGWNPLVIGGCSIHQGGGRHNYEFHLKFTGSKSSAAQHEGKTE